MNTRQNHILIGDLNLNKLTISYVFNVNIGVVIAANATVSFVQYHYIIMSALQERE